MIKLKPNCVCPLIPKSFETEKNVLLLGNLTGFFGYFTDEYEINISATSVEMNENLSMLIKRCAKGLKTFIICEDKYKIYWDKLVDMFPEILKKGLVRVVPEGFRGKNITAKYIEKAFEALRKKYFKGENYNINMSFDLIIANPPYGKQNALAKRITEILSSFKSVVILAPADTFMEKDIFTKCSNIVKLGYNPFEDASMHNLSIAFLGKEHSNTLDSLDILISDEKEKRLAKAVLEYNSKHKKQYENIAYFNTKENKSLAECKTYKGILQNANCKNIFDENRFFVYTIRAAGDRVHVEGEDTIVNRKDKEPWINPHKRYFDAFVFKDEGSKLNFSRWWNSCIVNGQKSFKGLTNAFLSIITDCVSGGAGVEAYETYFPHLDWSHPWTDKEILKEIELPEDFLENK